MLLVIILSACQPQQPTPPVTLPGPAATSKPTQTPAPTLTPTIMPSSVPTGVFEGKVVAADAILANSPVGGEWLIGATFELWAIAPDGTSDSLGAYTPLSAFWPWPTMSPDHTMLAFSSEEGGALYFLKTGQVVRFAGVGEDQTPAALSYFAWSADSQTLYYSNWPEVWQISVDAPDAPLRISKELTIPGFDCSLVPARGLPDGRLLMDCYVTQRSTAVIWEIGDDRAIPLMVEEQPIHIWDVDDDRILFDNGPHSALHIGEFGPQGQILDVVRIYDREFPAPYSQPMFMPDGSIVLVWYYGPSEDSVPYVVIFRETGEGWQGTALTAAEPSVARRGLAYEIAVYDNRLIVEVSDLATGLSILSDVPLDGSPASVLAEGKYQIVNP